MYPEPDMFTGGPRPSGRGADGKWHAEGEGRGGAGRGAATGARAGAAPGQPGTAAVPGRGRGGGGPVARHNMPSYGFYLRHVKGIQFDNIEIRTEQEDLRPPFVLDSVEDADFFRIKTPHVAGAPM